MHLFEVEKDAPVQRQQQPVRHARVKFDAPLGLDMTALPVGLAWITRFLPLTHGLALLRYGLLGDSSGLHDIWRMTSPTAMAGLSLAVVAAFAAILTTVSIRVFSRSARL